MSNSSGAKSPTSLITDLHLKKVLKTYSLTAMNSLSGPGSFQDSWRDNKIVTTTANNLSGGRALIHIPVSAAQLMSIPTVLSQNMGKLAKETGKKRFNEEDVKVSFGPLFSQPDNSSSERRETVFEGIEISYFMVGGEKRLCLAQLLTTVLTSYTLDEINSVCDELRIYISRCTVSQLECLKACKVLPTSAPSCGLITLTDAERLCGSLMHRKPDQEVRIANRDKCRHFPVVQRCFGKIEGTCFPDLYSHPGAACIECNECSGLFAPRHFVLHSHKSMEHSVCHWGFDSHNWRRYLLIPEEVEATKETLRYWRALLEELTSKSFELVEKRGNGKGVGMPSEEELSRNPPSKRIKIEEAVYPQSGGMYGPVGWYIPQQQHQQQQHMHQRAGSHSSSSSVAGYVATPNDLAASYTQGMISVNNVSLVTPSSAGTCHLNRGPPMLIHPERIVFASSYDKHDEKVQPNVALAPAQQSVLRPQSVIQQRLPSQSATVLVKREAEGVIRRDSEKSQPSTSSRKDSVDGRKPAPQSNTVVDDDDTSSSSTLSVDLRQESLMLDEDQEDLNGSLQYVDVETRAQLVQKIRKMKQRYSTQALQAEHELNKMEKDVQYYKVTRKDRIRELKAALAACKEEIASLKTELAARKIEVENERARTNLENGRCTATCVVEKEVLQHRIVELERANQELMDKLENLNAQKRSSPVLPSPGH